MPSLMPEDDVLSLAASASHFLDDEAGDFNGSEASSFSSDHTTVSEAQDSPVQSALRMALDCLKVAAPQQPASVPESAFFRHGRASTTFAVPHSEDYLRELHTCWRDPTSLSRLSADGRLLASMFNSSQAGLDRMPPVEPAIAALIVSPEEALRHTVRCPRPQCRVTDDLLTRAYNAGARAGRLGNSLAHLMFALSASLQEGGTPTNAVGFSDAALHTFALMTRELGRVMSYIVQARRQLRHWNELYMLERPGSNCLLSTALCRLQVEPELHPCLQGSAHPVVLLLENIFDHMETREPVGIIGEHHAHRLDNLGPMIQPVDPLGPQGAVGLDDEAFRPAVGYFTQQQLNFWAAQASDPWVVATLTHGYKLQFRRRPPCSSRVAMTIIDNPTKALALDQELSALLAKGAIEEVDPLLQPRGYYSRYFLVPKKTGGYRPILDLRGLNRYMKVLRFHMLTVSDVLRTISEGDWVTSIDLKDAYFHVPIYPHHRKFLRFAYRGRHWQFRVLPFGLSLSPRVFTRVVKVALAPLQAQGLKVLSYLDDWLICAESQTQVMRDTRFLLCHVDRLGLKVNLEKSCLVPSQLSTFLGVTLDTTTMLARPSVARVDDILLMLSQFRLGKKLPYIMFLRLLGKLTSVTQVVPLGLLTLRPLQRWLNNFHLDAELHRHRRIQVSWQCLCVLAPWRSRQYLLRGIRMGAVVYRREVVTTDACPTGWGAVWQRRLAQGRWPVQWHDTHINVLELRAVHLALKHFLPYLQGRHVLIRSDNITTVYHINHQGSPRSAQLLKASQDLLMWAAPRLCSLRATYLPGDRNHIADFLSRRKPLPGEWRLHPEVVRTIWHQYGMAEVDLFATRDTSHCPHWFSLLETTGSLGQDAFAHPWPRTLLYAFPPLPLIMPTLQRIFQEGHRVLLVAPFWPSQPWFPLLHRLCHSHSWRLPAREDLLSQFGGRIWHPNPRGFSCGFGLWRARSDIDWSLRVCQEDHSECSSSVYTRPGSKTIASTYGSAGSSMGSAPGAGSLVSATFRAFGTC
ncbi:hypothetical protein WMY93_019601 [Mugilogobius chulae]|uniref:ribonuclease H n=1 Tax=Mugilogobius chulae TaxID=88201 RepID=A0AAW0NG16_9GOBI